MPDASGHDLVEAVAAVLKIRGEWECVCVWIVSAFFGEAVTAVLEKKRGCVCEWIVSVICFWFVGWGIFMYLLRIYTIHARIQSYAHTYIQTYT